MGEDLSTTFSALTVNETHQVNTMLTKTEDVLQQIEQQGQEIMQLRKHLAEYTAKEAQIQNEKNVLERRIALMHRAFDQQQQDLVEATSKAMAYRQDIIEENIRIGYALQVAREERSVFISSLLPLVSDQSVHSAALDAYSIVSSLRVLFKHSKERLALAEEKFRDSQYQPVALDLNSLGKEFSSIQERVNINVERKTNGENVVNVVNPNYLPSILEEEQEQEQEQESSHAEEAYDSEEEDEYDHDDLDVNKPLPTIKGLQILGEPYPGNEIQASGYSKHGTTHCGFEWVRHLQDGSFVYIEGAKQPKYIVTADDVDNYLSVEVQPLDDRQRKGEIVRCFANDNRKITCHPDMIREIERTLILGHASFNLLVWRGSLNTWEPAVLEVKKSGYSIRLNGNGQNNSVVVNNKFTPMTVVSILAETSSEFAILGPDNVEHYLGADYDSNDVRCSRDTIVLTMRLFVKRAVDKKLAKKKKRRGLFF